jgi:hypothetical protein
MIADMETECENNPRAVASYKLLAMDREALQYLKLALERRREGK